jgi:ferredoxin--NADP+ reductase
VSKILEKSVLAPKVVQFLVEAPEIAQKCRAGQFVIVRICETGERIPLSIADSDKEHGTLTLVVQEVGKTSACLNAMEVGKEIPDVVGPLGRPTHIENFGVAIGVGGGVGIAPLHPILKALKAAGNHVITILGGRSKEFVIMEEEMRRASDEVLICTDDGSYGEKGFVTHVLKNLVETGRDADYCIAIGPPIMMKRVCEVTKPFNLTTYVSLNTIMVDGTGMCGCCRVTVDGKTRFVCVDGPEFDGHKVDFDEMIKRISMFRKQEELAYKRWLEKQASGASKSISSGEV